MPIEWKEREGSEIQRSRVTTTDPFALRQLAISISRVVLPLIWNGPQTRGAWRVLRAYNERGAARCRPVEVEGGRSQDKDTRSAGRKFSREIAPEHRNSLPYRNVETR